LVLGTGHIISVDGAQDWLAKSRILLLIKGIAKYAIVVEPRIGTEGQVL